MNNQMVLPVNTKIVKKEYLESIEYISNVKKYNEKMNNGLKALLFIWIPNIALYFWNIDIGRPVAESVGLISSMAILLPIIWMSFGKEKIIFLKDRMCIENVCCGMKFKKTIKYSSIDEVRINIDYREDDDVMMLIPELPKISGYNRGFVLIHEGKRQHRFGATFGPEEALYFVEKIECKIKK